MTAPGVQVNEVNSAGGTPIQPATSSIPAFIGPTNRGPTDKAVTVTSFAQFQRIFGPKHSYGYMAEAVRGFFQAAGDGARAYVVRVLAGFEGNFEASRQATTDNTAPSYGSLSSDDGVFPLQLAPGDTFDGEVDGGGAATATVQAAPAELLLSGGSYAAGGAGDSLTIRVRVSSAWIVSTVDFSSVGATRADYIALLNTVTGVQASADGASDILLSSDQKGSSASFEVTAIGGALATKLGISLGTTNSAGPNNVSDVDRVTSTELAALFQTTFTGSTATGADNTVVWRTNTLGASGSVQLTGGTGVAKVPGFDTDLHAGANTGTGENSVRVRAQNVGLWGNQLSVKFSHQDTLVGALASPLTSGDTSIEMTSVGAAQKLRKGDQVKIVNGGVQARGYVSTIAGRVVRFSAPLIFSGGPIAASGSSVVNETFTMSIYENAKLIWGPVRDLRMSPDSSRYVEEVFKKGVNPEMPVYVLDDAPSVSGTVDPRPVNEASDSYGDPLTGGGEVSSYADSDYESALPLLDRVEDVRLLCSAGVTGINSAGAVNRMLLDYSQRRALLTAILDVAGTVETAEDAKVFRLTSGGSSYGATYWPWGYVPNFEPGGAPVAAPLSGHICGRIVNTHRTKGVAKAPAGLEDGRLPGVLGLVGLNPGEDFDNATASLLNEGLVNLVRWKNGSATIMGARTMEEGQFLFLNVRLAFNYFKASFLKGTEFAIFEGPSPETYARVRRTLEGFLLRHWPRDLNGATPNEAFNVQCDERNNTPETEAAGITNVSVQLRVKYTTEVLNIDVSQMPSEEV